MTLASATRSIWALSAGCLLSLLPVFGGLASLAYAHDATRNARLFPEDYGPWLAAIVFCFGFAGACLLPGLALLSFHLRRSSVARWAFAFASIEALGVLAFILYVNLRA